MLYVKSYDEEIKTVSIANTDSDSIIKKKLDEIAKLEEVMGVIHFEYSDNEIAIPSASSMKAIQYIDLNDCTPVIIYEDHNERLNKSVKRLDNLNFKDNDSLYSEFLNIGDIALMACSSKESANDSFYIKDNYLYILIDDDSFYYTYLKYKVLNMEKLERLATKRDVLGALK